MTRPIIDWRWMRNLGRRGMLLAAVIALVAIWAVLRLLGAGKIQPGLLADQASHAGNRAFGVVLSQKLPISHELIGSVQSRIPVDAASRVSARVSGVRVHAGDKVKAGQVLVVLDASGLRAQVAQARGQVAAARAEVIRTAEDRKRFDALLARGSVTLREQQAAEAAYQSATARLAQAKGALAAAHSELDYGTVRSPVDGVVEEKLVEPGDMAMPGKPLVRLYDQNALRVELSVPEDLARSIKVGTLLEVRVGSQGATFQTHVAEIVPAADPSSRTFLIRAPIPHGGTLRPGMFARATFSSGTTTVITVPGSAVEEVGQLDTVHVVREGRIETRLVSLGRTFGDRVEVLAGLRPGDHVLLERAGAQGK